MKELQQKYADQGLVIIGVHTPFSADGLKEFVQQKGINYTVALDASDDGKKGKTLTRFRVDSFPDYYFIDRKGILRFADCANASIDDAIEELLAENP